MADIQEMFHQVHVTTEDRDVLRFLWWDQDDSSKEPLVYRMTVHLFGGVWSPSCSSYALRRTALDHQQDYSVDVINTIQNNFYVDDCLKSVASDDRAVQLVQELCELLAKGGFRLTKWVSTSREVLKSIPESEQAKDVKCLDLDRENLPIERALGVLWDVQSDTFKFRINMKEKPPTPRGLLSMVSSIYDPLGFVGPYVLLAKMLFQELCRRKVGWDDRMSQDVLDQWLRWLQDLPLLEQFSLPRCVRPPDFGTVVLCQLHHFSDASEKGYGAVTYLRMVDDLGGVYCCLLMSKSKLTPLKIKTIPRLELAAAVVSVKLEKLMRQQLEIPVHESLFWTDSMIVLNYIMNQDKRFHTFVANRVAAIQEVSQPSQWHHVDTSSNPADDVSRGMAAQDLVHSERWVKGPEFLWKAQDSWPQQPECFGKLADNDCEVKHASQVYATQTKDMSEENMVDQLFKYYSSWYKLKRAVAWLLRIKQLLHSRVPLTRSKTFLNASDPLTVTEIKQAEIAIVIYIQKDSFSEAIKKGSSVRKLFPTVSDCGVLCVRGRLGNTDLDTRTKHPWLLPSAHPVVDLII